MNDVIERINYVLWIHKISREELEQRTGISSTRWANTLQRKTKLRHEEIEALGRAWPEYMLWIAYGVETPKVEQISPMSEAAVKLREDERDRKRRKEALEAYKSYGDLSEKEIKELELLTNTRFSSDEIRDVLWEMEYEKDIWPRLPKAQDEAMKKDSKMYLEEIKNTKELDEYDAKKLELLTENKLSGREIDGVIIKMRREAREAKHSK